MDNYNPSHFLFPLASLPHLSTSDVGDTLAKLSAIYSKSRTYKRDRHVEDPIVHLTSAFCVYGKTKRVADILKQEIVIDSGYASAEEEEEGGMESGTISPSEAGDDMAEILDQIRNDTFEQSYTIRWLTGFISRSSLWTCPLSSLSDDEMEEREDLVNKAASLLTCCSGSEEDESDFSLSRRFEFTLGPETPQVIEILERKQECDVRETTIVVELNDAPVSTDDHTSVGLQSWGSSIIFARLMCQFRFTFRLGPLSDLRPTVDDSKLRILELGAGTGLLSITAAKVLANASNGSLPKHVSIVATDYHPDVLDNLRINVQSNFDHFDEDGSTNPVDVQKLDWECPSADAPFDERFDVILAADVIYNFAHAGWIKSCLEQLLEKPSANDPLGGVFWLMIPIRTAGRHEGMHVTVLQAFPFHPTVPSSTDDRTLVLKTVSIQDIERCAGVGRADESGYKLFKICWV